LGSTIFIFHVIGRIKALKKREIRFIVFSIMTLIVVLTSIVFFVSPNGLNAVLHLFIALTLLCMVVSLSIIVNHFNRKKQKKVFLIINSVASLFSIFGLAQILYNLPLGYSYPILVINGQYVDGTYRVISGLMSIVISVLFLTIFYTVYKAVVNRDEY